MSKNKIKKINDDPVFYRDVATHRLAEKINELIDLTEKRTIERNRQIESLEIKINDLDKKMKHAEKWIDKLDARLTSLEYKDTQ